MTLVSYSEKYFQWTSGFLDATKLFTRTQAAPTELCPSPNFRDQDFYDKETRAIHPPRTEFNEGTTRRARIFLKCYLDRRRS
jgi:hypothetical protein